MAAKSASPAALQILEEVGISELPEDWTVVRIEDLLSDERGISVGVMYPGDHDPLGIPLIKAGDLSGSRINPNPEFRVTKVKHHEYRRTELTGGELLISLVGNVGRCAVVPDNMAGWNAARAVAVLRFMTGDDAHFVRACLMSAPLQHLMQAWSTTTVQATLNLKEIRQLPLPWPPQSEREAIAHILGTLDDKIELNRRMNETLEGMARALFQSWFVDFDPVHRNIQRAQGHTPPSLTSSKAKSTADPLAEFDALFPDAFEDSELGPIPQGWRVDTVYSISNVIYGAPFASSQFNSEGLGLPLIRIRDLPGEAPGVWTPEILPKGYRVKPGDIVVGMDGEFRAYIWGGSEAWLNQRVCVFQPKAGVSAAFVRNAIIPPLAHIEATETATTVIHLGKGDIDHFRIITPIQEVLEIFNKLGQPLYDRIVGNKQESRTLASLRDTLLPKLISGELRVKDAEKFVEGVI